MRVAIKMLCVCVLVCVRVGVGLGVGVYQFALYSTGHRRLVCIA